MSCSFFSVHGRIYSHYILSHYCRRFKEKKEAVEPEADPERDQRTVFAYQVNIRGAIVESTFSDIHFYEFIYPDFIVDTSG